MAKQKQKRPTTRELKKEIAVLVREVFTLKQYVNDVLTPFVRTNMELLEKYLIHTGDIDKFVKYLEKEGENEKEIINESSEEGPQEQTEGSGITERVSKNGEGDGTGSIQHG